MPVYDTLTEALADLKQRGFTTDFNIEMDKIKCAGSGQCFSPSEFEITEHYRFEGSTDPGDESVVYAIAAKDGTKKGVLVSAYGMYSESLNEELIKKLTINE